MTTQAQMRFEAITHPWVSAGAEAVFIAPPGTAPLQLSPPTVWVWEELATGQTLQELCTALTGSPGSLADEAEPYILRQVQTLMELRLVRRLGPNDSERETHGRAPVPLRQE